VFLVVGIIYGGCFFVFLINYISLTKFWGKKSSEGRVHTITTYTKKGKIKEKKGKKKE
jgi:hypothetical protein